MTITIPDSLLEKNTTYKISLGNNVKDIYEGTPFANFNFTFSTGNFLDSLQLSGKVIKANSGMQDTGVWVELYSMIKSDSDIAKINPMYATKTDANGNFLFTNLPPKEFYIYAVGDKNNNYLLDTKGEEIAFFNTTVLPSAKPNEIKLYAFTEVPDTSSIFKNRKGSEVGNNNKQTLLVNMDTSDNKKRSFDITQPITIKFPKKIEKVDNSKIRLYQDSVLDATGIVVVDSNRKSIKINVDFVEDALYNLQLIDGFATDSNTTYKGNSYTCRTKKEKDYGTLKIIINKEKQPFQQLIELHQDDKIIATQMLKDSVISFRLLNPGTYTLLLIDDLNNNNKWDNGTYFGNKKQPEVVEKFPNSIIIKASWENKILWQEDKK